MSNVNLKNCSKNILQDGSIYDNFDKTCRLNNNTYISQNNPLIYCPKVGDAVLTPTINIEGNVYCTSGGEPLCKPKYDFFSKNPNDQIYPVCSDYGCSKNKFYLNGIPNISVTNEEECKEKCNNDAKCTGYTYYTSDGNGKCMMYDIPINEYINYEPFNFNTYKPSTKILNTNSKLKDTNSDLFKCNTEFNKYKATGNSTELDSCIDKKYNTLGIHNNSLTREELLLAVKDLSCQLSACKTEYIGRDGSINIFSNSDTLGGAINKNLEHSKYKTPIKWIYVLSIIVVIWMSFRFIGYKMNSSNPASLYSAFFGKNASTMLFIIPSAVIAFTILALAFKGKSSELLYITIVCSTILILMLVVINLLLTMKGFSDWKLPSGFQLIFMIIIVLGSIAGSIYFLYKSIKEKDYGSSVESEAPFIKIPKIHNYGYIALIITIIVGLIAFLIALKEIFGNIKHAQYSGQMMNIKSITKSIGIISSALYGILGGINMILAIYAPYFLLTLVLFERVFGSIITRLSKKEGFIQNLVSNIGRIIYGSRKLSNPDEYLWIGQEYFGGGVANGWAPFGTTLLNILLSIMTNFNYILSRSSIPISNKTSGRPTIADNIRVRDMDMWKIMKSSWNINTDSYKISS